ncbi:MAG: lactonase family protein [Sporolactobacillus sp.]
MGYVRGYIGTYTKEASEGIYSFLLDPEHLTLDHLTLVATLGNPTYLAVNKNKQMLYAVDKEGEEGGAASYSIHSDGFLTQNAVHLSRGASPCYIAINHAADRVATGNYHRGTLDVYGLTDEAALGTLLAAIRHEGKGADPDRQESAHIHYTDFTPDDRFIVTVDLGLDRLTTYEEVDNQLVARYALDFPAKTGPRHLVFHPTLPIAYVLSELSSEIFVLDYDAEEGRFTMRQTLRALPADFAGHNQGAAIKIAPDGRFLYVSNRGHNSIGVYQAAADGTLTPCTYTATGGSWPRDFIFDPTGRLLIVANQETGNLVLFERDQESGHLSAPKAMLDVPDPTCVLF